MSTTHFLYTRYMFDPSQFDAVAQRRIEIATGLFSAWSSGDPDAPEPFWTPDGVLDDVASGVFEGWPAIRAFFASGLTRTHDLVLAPQQFWSNDDGLALAYEMSGDVVEPDRYGPEFVGRRWSVRCMSFLRFDGDRVCYEADFHDKGARTRSLGVGV